MFKSIVFSTVFTATAALQAAAEPASKHDLSILPADVAARVAYLEQYGDRFAPVIQATLAEWSKPSYSDRKPELDLSVLPTDVAARVAALQKHGDRFDAAIRAIFFEAMKPGSGFCKCDGAAEEFGNLAPES